MAYRPSRKFLVFVAAVAVPLVLFAYGAERVKGGREVEADPVPAYSGQEEAPEEHVEETQGQDGLTVVVDAGHGDTDPGTIGPQTGRYEKEVNLEIALKLRDALVQKGVNVVMTRENDSPLGTAGEPDVAARKEADMCRREEIIENAGAQCFVSIHQNRFDDPDVRGPQVLYLKNKADGKEYWADFAQAIQQTLNEDLGIERPRGIDPGNWRLLKKGGQPACIVECGFFSNPEEEALLQTDDYQNRIVAAIIRGMENYLEGYGM